MRNFEVAVDNMSTYFYIFVCYFAVLMPYVFLCVCACLYVLQSDRQGSGAS